MLFFTLYAIFKSYKSLIALHIVVMINQKPNVSFKHVKVKTLNELNGYIKFFDPIFTDEEFNTVKDKIIEIYNINSL